MRNKETYSNDGDNLNDKEEGVDTQHSSTSISPLSTVTQLTFTQLTGKNIIYGFFLGAKSRLIIYIYIYVCVLSKLNFIHI